MIYRTRINYSAEQKIEIWDRWQRGEPLNSLVGHYTDLPLRNMPFFDINQLALIKNND